MGDLLFKMIKIPNRIQHSNEIDISAKEVFFVNGNSAIMPVYTPAKIAKMIILLHVRFVSLNNFFIFNMSLDPLKIIIYLFRFYKLYHIEHCVSTSIFEQISKLFINFVLFCCVIRRHASFFTV